ncbi:UNVERIFIED_CONTAM: hypothetical protein RMT77_005555 [Armadillidium vulgare]
MKQPDETIHCFHEEEYTDVSSNSKNNSNLTSKCFRVCCGLLEGGKPTSIFSVSGIIIAILIMICIIISIIIIFTH